MILLQILGLITGILTFLLGYYTAHAVKSKSLWNVFWFVPSLIMMIITEMLLYYN